MRDILNLSDKLRINRLNSILILGISIMVTINGFATKGSEYGWRVFLSAFSAVALCVLCRWIVRIYPAFSNVSALLIPFSVAVASSYLGHLQAGESTTRLFLVYAFSMAMVSLYFSKRLLLVHLLGLNLLIFLFFRIDPQGLMQVPYTIADFVGRLVLLNCGGLIFYFLTDWGSRHITAALQKERQSNEWVERLERTLQAIDRSVLALNHSISNTTAHSANALTSSKEIATAVEHVAVGIANQSESTVQVLHLAEASSEKVRSTLAHSSNVYKLANDIQAEIEINRYGIDELHQHISTVDQAVGTALDHVEHIQQGMRHIAILARNIEELSKQTTILSLNASIEASRSGESGKGFAVIAEEVQKLAIRSSDTTLDIHRLVQNVTSLTTTALTQVTAGKTAADQGVTIVSGIGSSFVHLSRKATEIHHETEKEDLLINEMHADMHEIQRQISVVSGITNDHTSVTQQILAAIEEQSHLIQQVDHEMQDVSRLGASLLTLRGTSLPGPDES